MSGSRPCVSHGSPVLLLCLCMQGMTHLPVAQQALLKRRCFCSACRKPVSQGLVPGLVKRPEHLCRALRQRQRCFPVLLLSTGGTCWHADARRMSIAAAIQWALQSNLQGLVLDSGAVQEQSQAVALARSKGLKVRGPPATPRLMSMPHLPDCTYLTGSVEDLGLGAVPAAHGRGPKHVVLFVHDGTQVAPTEGLLCRC